MENLIMEMAVRYVVGGLIMYAALFVGLMARIVVLLFRNNNSAPEAIIRGRRITDYMDKQAKAPKWMMAVRYIVWPYGILKILSGYLKTEPKMIEKMMGGDN